jgi:hypothetical protein
MGNDSASSAQSKCRLGSGTSGGAGVIFRSGVSTNSSCRRAEREPWGSGWGSGMMVGFELVDASMFFDVCGCSSSGGSVCVAAALGPEQSVVWVSASTKMGLVIVVWVSASAVGGLDMLVKSGADGETARLQGVWGKLGGCDACQGCSTGSGDVSRRFWAAGRGPEWSRAGGLAVIDRDVVDDVADPVDASGVEAGSLCVTGARGARWGRLGGVGGQMDGRCGRWGRQESSVEQTTRSNERVGV